MNPYRPYRLSAVPQILHTQLEIANTICTLAGPDADELLQQRRAELAAIRRDCGQLALFLHELRQEWDPRVRSYVMKFNPDQPRVLAGNPDGGQWRSDDQGGAQVHHQVSVMRNQAAGSGRVRRHSKQRESRRGEFRRPERLNVKHNMHRTFFNVKWWD